MAACEWQRQAFFRAPATASCSSASRFSRARRRPDRRFINAEIFNFNPTSGLLDRSTGIVTHDIEYTIERPMLSGDVTIGGLRNRFAVGAEASSLSFATRRYFSTTASVDLFAPVRGTFPGGTGSLPPPNQNADVDVAAVFFENAINRETRGRLNLPEPLDLPEFAMMEQSNAKRLRNALPLGVVAHAARDSDTDLRLAPGGSMAGDLMFLSQQRDRPEKYQEP